MLFKLSANVYTNENSSIFLYAIYTEQIAIASIYTVKISGLYPIYTICCK